MADADSPPRASAVPPPKGMTVCAADYAGGRQWPGGAPMPPSAAPISATVPADSDSLTAAASGEGAEPDPQFAAILEKVLPALPPDAAVRAALRAGLERHWRRPPAAAMTLVRPEEPPSEADARRCLFHPTPDDMERWYPQLLLAPSGSAPPSPGPSSGSSSPPASPSAGARTPALTLLYLLHHQQWPLARAFILGGGLVALTPLLLDPDLYVRAQAVEIVHRITNGYGEAFDWWQPPTPEGLLVHRRLFELAPAPFLRNLLLNLPAGSSFPGGSLLCLQVAAFWLSYVRRVWTTDGVLRLTQETLDALEAHAKRADIEEAEAGLAGKVFEDFNRWPALEVLTDNGLRDTAAGGSPSKAADPTSSAPSPEVLKEQGNALFKAGNLEPAAALYTAAIDLARAQGGQDPALNARLAVYCGNRAAVYAKLWETPPPAAAADANARWAYAAQCLRDCDAAIAADPAYLKPHFRKAAVLLDVGSRVEMVERRAEYLAAAARAVSAALQVAPTDEAVNDLADRIQRTLRATTDRIEESAAAAKG